MNGVRDQVALKVQKLWAVEEVPPKRNLLVPFIWVVLWANLKMLK